MLTKQDFDKLTDEQKDIVLKEEEGNFLLEHRRRMFRSSSVVTSYSNPLGSGDRTATITVSATIVVNGTPSNYVNGNKSETVTYFTTDATPSGKYLRFDFGSSKVINEIKYYQELTTNQAVFKIQGSPDASTWTDLGGTFTLGGATTQTITTPSDNVTAYRYYQLLCTSNGTGMSGTPYVYEFEFKIN